MLIAQLAVISLILRQQEKAQEIKEDVFKATPGFNPTSFSGWQSKTAPIITVGVLVFIIEFRHGSKSD
ncbi:MAG: hypothetical protein NW224_14070 [Leptolyngbyaceae cyanobacterium bins.302]|nr:hypothetical protein [Leptolyngbyaceae cyanobacterium bins.302]